MANESLSHSLLLFIDCGLGNFKLGRGVVIETDKDGCGVKRPQVAMHSQMPYFLGSYFLIAISVNRTCCLIKNK